VTDPDIVIYRRELPRLDPRLGRTIAHDPRSRGFARPTPVDKSTWRTKTIRIYDPVPNPNQVIGNCTGVGKCVEFNSVGDRKTGVILKMHDADRIYSLATHLDNFAGAWNLDGSGQDTGSSGLYAAKAAAQLGLGGDYFWIFDGADGVVQAVMDGDTVEIGSRWDQPMFDPDSDGVVHPDPRRVAGGHEWTVRGYDKARDLIMGRCWWGSFRDFWISRRDLDALLADDGDAHVQARI
jgi:hypothetical protein